MRFATLAPTNTYQRPNVVQPQGDPLALVTRDLCNWSANQIGLALVTHAPDSPVFTLLCDHRLDLSTLPLLPQGYELQVVLQPKKVDKNFLGADGFETEE